jgi:hypothetical protein
MKFLNRHFPLLSWIPMARKARLIPKGLRSKIALTRQTYVLAEQVRLPRLKDASNQPDICAVQFQMARPSNMRFLPMDNDIDNLPLGENEVLFVPFRLGANRYITNYSESYIVLDAGNFVDPRGEQNTQSFKTAPIWGRCTVYRSNHPDIKPGSTYYSFWPLAAYSVRKVTNVDSQGFIGYQDLPNFTGPKEWLKIIKMDNDDASHVIENYEYMKIGITYARELRDFDYFGAERLVVSSASSASGQIIAMCLKELNPNFKVVGLTSARNLEFVKQFSYFDEVYTYDEIKASPNSNKSLYFDALGWDSVTKDVFDHFKLSRWWIYGEGADKTFVKYLKKNRRGTFYTNLADSYIYQIRNGITDAEMLDQCRSMIAKYNLDELWYSDLRTISSSQEVFDLYHAFINNTHTGERVVYQSPLYKNLDKGSHNN